MNNKFSTLLINWYEENRRNLPWRGTKDVYKVWLSEIILQQTRVQQGLDYYNKFVSKYPTIFDLASASEDQILSDWQGLGYYSRARNLHNTAKKVAFEFDGVFPSNKKELMKLKGIGDYTSSAIASFCFDEATPVIDGNVFRFIGRLKGIFSPIDLPETKKEIQKFLQNQIPKKGNAPFNQGLMEMGALVCTPKKPNCENCPFSNSCYAFLNNCQEELPVKGKKIKVKTRYLNYLLYKEDGKLALQKRFGKDIWENLFEFPLIETELEHEVVNLKILISEYTQLKNPSVDLIGNYKHKLTHQVLIVNIWKLNNVIAETPKNWIFVNSNELNKFALPRVLTRFWEDFTNNGLQLQIV